METFKPLEKILTKSDIQFNVFFRNDDGGWAQPRLNRLCESFIRLEIPLDIAVIPDALNTASANTISNLLTSGESLFHVHQHGFSHTNHQREGRACEFGSDRAIEQQYQDISRGKSIMDNIFGHHADPIFTPPWNRCTTETTSVLKSLDFSWLSRIAGSTDIDSDIPELPVAVDWLKKKKGVRLTDDNFIEYICRFFASSSNTVAKTIGIMLHHEPMNDADHDLLVQFVDVLKNSQRVRFQSMLETTKSESRL